MSGSGKPTPLRRSERWRRALSLIPGGVNSPVRAMRGVGLDEPFFAARGEGAYLETADGRRLVDWVQSWGPLIFGHADPETVEAVREAALDGTTFGAPTEREVELAAEIVDAVPRSSVSGSSRRGRRPGCRRFGSPAASRTATA